ncbi:MAG: hypothetical protein IT423_10455 [Pirellulaceae bacterium]|nr:hypothetical protein [Pirellulaceae bacterium]
MMHSLKRLPLYVIAYLDRWGGRVVCLLISLVFVAGCFYSFALGDHLPYIDEIDYQAIATHLVSSQFFSNDGIEPNADRAPVWPWAMAGLMALGAEVPHFRVMNFVFFCLTLWLLYLLVVQIRGPSRRLAVFAGSLATLLAVGYPVLFYSAGTLFPQTIGALLFVLVLFLLVHSQTVWKQVAVGAVFGVLLLAVPMFLFTLPIVLVWLTVVRTEHRLRAPAVVLLACIAVVSGWTFRNYVAFGMFVPLTSSSGAALLWGNAPEATIGGAEVDYLIDAYEKSDGMNQAQADKFRLKLALEQMSNRKLEVIGFYFYKVLNHFSFVNDHYAKSEIAIWKTVLMACTYCPLLLLLIVRLALWRRYPLGHFEILLVAIYFSAAFSYAIFHTRIRYRLPYDYALIALVALFVSQWLDARWSQRTQPTVNEELA